MFAFLRRVAGSHVHSYATRSPLARCETSDCLVPALIGR